MNNQDHTEKSGNCARCEGKYEIFAKWSRETGTEYRECPKCKGVGKALGIGKEETP